MRERGERKDREGKRGVGRSGKEEERGRWVEEEDRKETERWKVN